MNECAVFIIYMYISFVFSSLFSISLLIFKLINSIKSANFFFLYWCTSVSLNFSFIIFLRQIYPMTKSQSITTHHKDPSTMPMMHRHPGEINLFFSKLPLKEKRSPLKLQNLHACKKDIKERNSATNRL